jgi:hypothetical protein
VIGHHANRRFPRRSHRYRFATGGALECCRVTSAPAVEFFAPDAQLNQADDLSWLNSLIAAKPLYRKAKLEFAKVRELSKALFVEVSEMQAHRKSSTSFPDLNLELRIRWVAMLRPLGQHRRIVKTTAPLLINEERIATIIFD